MRKILYNLICILTEVENWVRLIESENGGAKEICRKIRPKKKPKEFAEASFPCQTQNYLVIIIIFI